MLVEKGTLQEGFEVDGEYFRDYVLEEERFRHTLEVANDPDIDNAMVGDSTYFSASLFAKRLQVEGLDKVTPEMVLDLCRGDGQELLHASARLELRRGEFRKKG